MRITILGAGLVVKPIVDYLAGHGYHIIVADIVASKAEALAAPYENVTGVELDSRDQGAMEKLVTDADLVMSLLPATLHVQVARLCIRHKKHMVTASYVSPEMRSLDADAKNAGITILNEIGLDPGIDHMSAMRIIDGIREKGGTITGFRSYCGGLPALFCNNNPYGYKFSWSPRGVLQAAKNSARYLKDGELVEIESKNLFRHYWFLDVAGAGTFEAYPNRDSISYIDTYGLEGIKTMYRGTLRNVGHCDTWWLLANAGFMDAEKVFDPMPDTLQEFTRDCVLGVDIAPEEALSARFPYDATGVTIRKLRWLGLFSDAPVPIKKGTCLDVMTALMEDRLVYADDETDLIVMLHEFSYEMNGKPRGIVSSLVCEGDPEGQTAMSRTVGLPAAIGARMILEQQIEDTGVVVPVRKTVYEPVLKELEEHGVTFNEYEAGELT